MCSQTVVWQPQHPQKYFRHSCCATIVRSRDRDIVTNQSDLIEHSFTYAPKFFFFEQAGSSLRVYDVFVLFFPQKKNVAHPPRCFFKQAGEKLPKCVGYHLKTNSSLCGWRWFSRVWNFSEYLAALSRQLMSSLKIHRC